MARGRYDGNSLVDQPDEVQRLHVVRHGRQSTSSDALQVVERYTPDQRRHAAVRSDDDRSEGVYAPVDDSDDPSSARKTSALLDYESHRDAGRDGRSPHVAERLLTSVTDEDLSMTHARHVILLSMAASSRRARCDVSFPSAASWDAPAAWRAWTAASRSNATAPGPIPAAAGWPSRPQAATFNGSLGGVDAPSFSRNIRQGSACWAGQEPRSSTPPDGVIPYQPWAPDGAGPAAGKTPTATRTRSATASSTTSAASSFTQDTCSSRATTSSSTQHAAHHAHRCPLDRREHLPSGIRLWLGDPIGSLGRRHARRRQHEFQREAAHVARRRLSRRRRARVVERFTMLDAEHHQVDDDARQLEGVHAALDDDVAGPDETGMQPAADLTSRTPATRATLTSCI